MAIPKLSAIEQCGDFAYTVQPFLPQLLELPQKLLAVDGTQALLDIYIGTNPFITGLAGSLVMSVLVLIFSELNRNYSQVDRLWSIVPAIYAGHFALWARVAGVTAPRVNLAWAFSVIWSARLTFNYWRKGGYNVGSEDYRWPIIRAKLHPIIAFVFNVIFISFIQSVLLYSLTAPIYAMLLSSQFEEKVMAGDLLFYGVELILIFTEGIADQQQWEFQTAKQQYRQTAKVPRGFTQTEMDRGFVASGLWAHSRHPNFACEQLIWFVLYQWSCYTNKVLYSWTGLGCLCLVALFQGSTWLTEQLSADKYPEYQEYQKQVAMFLPVWFSGYKGRGELPKPKIIKTSELEKMAKQSGGVRRRAV